MLIDCSTIVIGPAALVLMQATEKTSDFLVSGDLIRSVVVMIVAL